MFRIRDRFGVCGFGFLKFVVTGSGFPCLKVRCYGFSGLGVSLSGLGFAGSGISRLGVSGSRFRFQGSGFRFRGFRG